MRRWFKLFMRRRTQRISVPYAKEMKKNLSLVYCFFAWNAAGLYAYYLMKKSYPMTEAEKKRPSHYYARLWRGEDVTVVDIKGFTVTNTYQIKGVPKLIPDEEEFLPKESTAVNYTENSLIN